MISHGGLSWEKNIGVNGIKSEAMLGSNLPLPFTMGLGLTTSLSLSFLLHKMRTIQYMPHKVVVKIEYVNIQSTSQVCRTVSPTSQVLVIIAINNLRCVRQKGQARFDMGVTESWVFSIKESLNSEDKFGHRSSGVRNSALSSHASSAAHLKALTQVLTPLEGGQRPWHSSLRGNYWEEAVDRKLLPIKKPFLLQ